MPSKRSKPAVHRGVGLDLDWRPFDAATVERLIQVTRFPAPPIDTGAISLDDVARVLNVIAIWWKAGSDASDAPTDKMVEDALGSLAKALRRECNLAPLHAEISPWTGEPDDNPRLPPRLAERLRPFVTQELRRKYADRFLPGVPDPDSLLAEFVENLVDLSNVVSAATAAGCASDAQEMPATRAVLDVSHPNRTLVQELAKVYSALFEREVRRSRRSDRNKPSGPMLRFLRSALEALQITIPDETLIGHIEPISRKRYDAHAVFRADHVDDDHPIIGGWV